MYLSNIKEVLNKIFFNKWVNKWMNSSKWMSLGHSLENSRDSSVCQVLEIQQWRQTPHTAYCYITTFKQEFNYFKNRVSYEKKVKVKSFSRVWLFEAPWTVAYLAPPSMGFSRQEYWSGLPFPSPGDLPNPGIKPGSPAL